MLSFVKRANRKFLTYSIALAGLLASPVHALAMSKSESLPVVEFANNALVQSSLVTIERAFHRINVDHAGLLVESNYRLRLPRDQRLSNLTVWSDLAEALRLESEGSASIDGVSVRVEPIARRPGCFLVIPSSNWLPLEFDLRIRYRINNYTPQALYVLNSNNFLTPSRIVRKDNQLGIDIRKPSSYADKITTGADIRVPPSHFILGSGLIIQRAGHVTIEPTKFGRFVLVLAPKDSWLLNEFQVGNTSFTYLSKKIGSTIEALMVEQSVRFGWQKLADTFGTYTSHVVLIEADGPLGGGAIGSNVLALYSMMAIPANIQEYLKAITGAPALASTRAYADYIYRKSKNPMFDYVATIAIHELGHLYFGFGQAVERYPETYQTWLSLGLGILYDNEITRELIGSSPALFQLLEEKWRREFDVLSGVDQRLQNPNTASDALRGVMPFHRVQLYAHGKAGFVLRQLRRCAGSAAFDEFAQSYLNHGGEPDGYISFRKGLMTLCPSLSKLEASLRVL